MMGITIVGVGRVGGALALALSGRDYKIDRLIYRDKRAAAKIAAELRPRPKLATIDKVSIIDSSIIFITTQDDAIESVAASLVGKVAAETCVFHTSGALSSDVLEPLRRVGCAVGSIHPLASISTPALGTERFSGSYFCLEGDTRAVRVGRKIVNSLGGKPFQIDPSAKVVYHSAAVMASGHVTALFDMAVELMQKAGLNERKAHEVLQPLLAGTAANLANQSTAVALTGPFARADVDALSRQLTALGRSMSRPDFLVYLTLTEHSLEMAEKRHADPKHIRKMRQMILLAKRNLQC